MKSGAGSSSECVLATNRNRILALPLVMLPLKTCQKEAQAVKGGHELIE